MHLAINIKLAPYAKYSVNGIFCDEAQNLLFD